MSRDNDGGSAFPQSMVDFGKGPEEPGPYGMGGMSLRDYFAGQALMGLYASSVLKTDIGIDETAMRARASLVLAQADAMLAEREK